MLGANSLVSIQTKKYFQVHFPCLMEILYKQIDVCIIIKKCFFLEKPELRNVIHKNILISDKNVLLDLSIID